MGVHKSLLAVFLEISSQANVAAGFCFKAAFADSYGLSKERKKVQPVKIRILSSAEGGTRDLEMTFSGKMTEKNGKHYVIYEEDAQSGLDNTRTTLKWDSERAVIIRSGAVESRQEFCRGLKYQSVYRTPYLELPLVTETRFFDAQFRKGVWRLRIEYGLCHGGEPYGDIKIVMEIEEEL